MGFRGKGSRLATHLGGVLQHNDSSSQLYLQRVSWAWSAEPVFSSRIVLNGAKRDGAY